MDELSKLAVPLALIAAKEGMLAVRGRTPLSPSRTARRASSSSRRRTVGGGIFESATASFQNLVGSNPATGGAPKKKCAAAKKKVAPKHKAAGRRQRGGDGEEGDVSGDDEYGVAPVGTAPDATNAPYSANTYNAPPNAIAIQTGGAAAAMRRRNALVASEFRNMAHQISSLLGPAKRHRSPSPKRRVAPRRLASKAPRRAASKSRK